MYKEQYSTGFVLVFSGAISPLARAIIKFWCAGMKLSNLVGIVINFLCIVSCFSLLLWCFSLEIASLSFSFLFIKILMLQGFHPSKIQTVLLNPLVT
jgi:hypothetical protein